MSDDLSSAKDWTDERIEELPEELRSFARLNRSLGESFHETAARCAEVLDLDL